MFNLWKTISGFVQPAVIISVSQLLWDYQCVLGGMGGGNDRCREQSLEGGLEDIRECTITM